MNHQKFTYLNLKIQINQNLNLKNRLLNMEVDMTIFNKKIRKNLRFLLFLDSMQEN